MASPRESFPLALCQSLRGPGLHAQQKCQTPVTRPGWSPDRNDFARPPSVSSSRIHSTSRGRRSAHAFSISSSMSPPQMMSASSPSVTRFIISVARLSLATLHCTSMCWCNWPAMISTRSPVRSTWSLICCLLILPRLQRGHPCARVNHTTRILSRFLLQTKPQI